MLVGVDDCSERELPAFGLGVESAEAATCCSKGLGVGAGLAGETAPPASASAASANGLADASSNSNLLVENLGLEGESSADSNGLAAGLEGVATGTSANGFPAPEPEDVIASRKGLPTTPVVAVTAAEAVGGLVTGSPKGLPLAAGAGVFEASRKGLLRSNGVDSDTSAADVTAVAAVDAEEEAESVLESSAGS